MQVIDYPSIGGDTLEELAKYADSRDRLHLTLPISNFLVDPETGYFGDYPMTIHAAKSLAHMLKIPPNFIERTPTENAAQNFNFFLPSASGNVQLAIEVVNGQEVVTGIMSESTTPVPLPLIVEELGSNKHGLDLTSWSHDERGLMARFVSPRISVEPRVGDIVKAGVDFFNYENDNDALDIRGNLYRLACTNGATVQEVAYGRRLKKEGWKEPTQIVLAAVNYFGAVCMDVGNFASALQGLTDVAFDLPDDEDDQKKVIRKPLRVVGVSPRFDENVIDAMHTEENTFYGLYNALTRLGRDADGRDNRFIFERAGYRMVAKKDEVDNAYAEALADVNSN